MRKLLFLIAVVATLPVANSYGQSAAYYNFRNPLHALGAYSACMYVDTPAGMFYTIGNTWDSVNIISPGLAYPAFGIRFSKWRISDGQLLGGATSQQGLLDTTTGNTRTYSINQGNKPGLHRLPNGNFLTAIRTVDTGEYYRLGLLCMDSMGNKLWLKEFQKPTCVVPRAQFGPLVMRRNTYGEWIILGQNSCNDRTSGLSYGDVVLMKLDSNFNLLWTKLFPMPPDYNFTPTCLLVEPDGYMVGINYSKWDQNNYWNPSINRAHIFRVDTAGIIQWGWASDISVHERVTDIIRTPDSGFVFTGAGGVILIQGGTPGASYQLLSMVQKLSKTRQVEWRFIDTMSDGGYSRILPAPGGGRGYYVTGTNGDWWIDSAQNSVSYWGGLSRIDDTGRLLWRHTYKLDSVSLSTAAFYDMSYCGGGDVLLTGLSVDQSLNPTQNVQQAWIVKVDSNGCIGPNDPQCSPQAVEQVAFPTAGVQVYPNPTTGMVRVTIGTAAQMNVTDLTGRVVLTASLQAGSQELSLINLPNGLYLYRIQTTTGAVFTGKLVKQ